MTMKTLKTIKQEALNCTYQLTAAPMVHVTSIGLGETHGCQCPLYPEAGLLCNPGLTQAMGVSLMCFSFLFGYLFLCLSFTLTP